MLGSRRRSSVLVHSVGRRDYRPDVERMPHRCLLSAVALRSATQTAYNTVAIDYEVASTSLSSLTVELYRSNSSQLNAGNQVAIGAVTLSGGDVTPGVHNNVPLVLGQRSAGVQRARDRPGTS